MCHHAFGYLEHIAELSAMSTLQSPCTERKRPTRKYKLLTRRHFISGSTFCRILNLHIEEYPLFIVHPFTHIRRYSESNAESKTFHLVSVAREQHSKTATRCGKMLTMKSFFVESVVERHCPMSSAGAQSRMPALSILRLILTGKSRCLKPLSMKESFVKTAIGSHCSMSSPGPNPLILHVGGILSLSPAPKSVVNERIFVESVLESHCSTSGVGTKV